MSETFYTPEQAYSIKKAIQFVKEHDDLFLKHAQLKQELTANILKMAEDKINNRSKHKLKSAILKKLRQEDHASRTISKNWKKREGTLASESSPGIVKLTQALSKKKCQ